MSKELESIINKVKELPMEQYIYNAKNNSIELNGVDDFVLVSKNKLKALEIIKEKKVDVQLLKISKNLNDYNWCVHTKDRALIQKEYDLLKEVLL